MISKLLIDQLMYLLILYQFSFSQELWAENFNKF